MLLEILGFLLFVLLLPETACDLRFVTLLEDLTLLDYPEGRER